MKTSTGRGIFAYLIGGLLFSALSGTAAYFQGLRMSDTWNAFGWEAFLILGGGTAVFVFVVVPILFVVMDYVAEWVMNGGKS
jgi:hypothetical protein